MDRAHDRQVDESLAFAARRFDDRREQIEMEYRHSDAFRSLCRDYLICAKAREKWQSSDSPIAAKREGEYAEWLTELENEIHDWLERL